jgi:hypothetical protein
MKGTNCVRYLDVCIHQTEQERLATGGKAEGTDFDSR